MKKFMPKSVNSHSGFTLIELLVVITIIAILATIGFVVYASIGAQAKSRNIIRKSDLDSIAKALEVNKNTTGNYVVLADNQFTNLKIPTTDPQGNLYCANSVASVQPTDPTSSWTSTCPTTSSTYGAVGTTNPPAGTTWKLCTWLEAEVNPTKAAQVFCKQSAQ